MLPELSGGASKSNCDDVICYPWYPDARDTVSHQGVPGYLQPRLAELHWLTGHRAGPVALISG